MKRYLLVVTAVLLAMTGTTASGQAVYKCAGPNGSVSFQDRPCAGAVEQQTVRVGKQARKKPAGYQGKVVPLPGGAEAAIQVFDYVDVSVRRDGERATTVTLRSKQDAPARMTMVLTIMPNKQGTMLSREQHENAVKRIAAQRAGRRFTDYQWIEFEARSGVGLLSVLDNRQGPDGAANAGGYAILTAGLIANNRYIVALTILTDGDSDTVQADAIRVAKTLFIASNIMASNGGAGELPKPPAGFSWERAPRIKGALLKPDGWYFKTRHEGDEQNYFVSRDPYIEPDGYDTGFSLNVQTDVPSRKGMSASAHAAAFVRAMQNEFETLEAPSSQKSGPFVSHGVVVRATDPEKGDFNALMFAIANDVTGTVYFCIFEGPADEWDALWPVGNTILQKLLINDSI